ncbi:amidase signature enzyme [Crucibulum laeve]|uniref:Amidase signature enzyme n=1 Tax=Crucibulum laeve TaxID=68775 RepID=A0A5C3LFH9_9AGAR|nr:amidase signature enzyme [Crucibulum laeve]
MKSRGQLAKDKKITESPSEDAQRSRIFRNPIPGALNKALACALVSTLIAIFLVSNDGHMGRWWSAVYLKSHGYSFPDLYEASITELQDGLSSGHFSSVQLVKAYLTRIEEVNLKGPKLRSILEINPFAIRYASQLDAERRRRGKRSLLHGIPILVKDNMATRLPDGMNTTAGSYSLLGSIVSDEAEAIKRLRKAGAIIIGKTNLSEFSHFRSELLALGWSARGGQSNGAYYPGADPCGSSSGSAIAVSIGLATAALGSETDGSIACPSSNNNVVGIKPTVGLTSRSGVIPISSNQDSVGPITRSVTDAAIILSILSGKDKKDKHTLLQPSLVPDFTMALRKDAFKGKRIGVPRKVFLDGSMGKYDPSVILAFRDALDVITKLGATVIDPADLPSAKAISVAVTESEFLVTDVDFKIEINAYFQSLKSNPSRVRSLEDLIKFNDKHPELEKPTGFEDQSRLTQAQARNGRDTEYFEALALNHYLGRKNGIDAAIKQYNLDALVLPSPGYTLGTTPAALAGYPIVTVPLGFYPDHVSPVKSGPDIFYPAPGIPFGLLIFGTAFSELELIAFAFAFEQETRTRLKRKAFESAVPRTQLKDFK